MLSPSIYQVPVPRCGATTFAHNKFRPKDRHSFSFGRACQSVQSATHMFHLATGTEESRTEAGKEVPPASVSFTGTCIVSSFDCPFTLSYRK